MISILTIFASILGLSFLIFIHELGHFWMARRVGMRVETFSIGFGKPIYSWESNGVKWQICWIIFGGFVKIAGTETDGKVDPQMVPDGFFGKSPFDRIKVAFMGPLTNLVFAFIAFALLWSIGGRNKPFSEFTHKIGWVDPVSELYVQGIRPGDEVDAYDGAAFTGERDHLSAPLLSGDKLEVSGEKVDYTSLKKLPFDVEVATYPHPLALTADLSTSGILAPAKYLYYDKMPGGKENPLPEGSPMKRSGLEYGDRIVWVDGRLIFSVEELKQVINDNRALLTIKRGNDFLLRRVPRVRAEELNPHDEFRQELIDWQFEAGLKDQRFQTLWTIPYNMTYDCVIEEEMKFIDQDTEEQVFPQHPFSSLEEPILPGDKIVSAQGVSVKYAYQLLNELQVNRVNVIVQREGNSRNGILYEEVDATFDRSVNWKELNQFASRVGMPQQQPQQGAFFLLKPIVPKSRMDLLTSIESKSWLTADILEKKKAIESIEDHEKRTQLMTLLENQEKELMLGILLQDQVVNYNPNPIQLFQQVFSEIARTVRALFTGAMSLKFLSGPIGIVAAVQQTATAGITEALYWLGFISLNLGMLNLLPIPVLDGGTIVFSFFEIISGKRIKPKTLERMILPFMLLFLALFVYLTYQDVARILQKYIM